MHPKAELIVIGGSWGGIQASLKILKDLPENYSIPIVLVLHRLRTEEGSLEEVFNKKLKIKVVEIDDKMVMLPGHIYLAPANYHVLIEKDNTFSLDDSELENYARPSIDVTFTSVADVFQANAVGVLLSGASKDGSVGLKHIHDNGGVTIAQFPPEAEVETMPQAAIDLIGDCQIMTLENIKVYLLTLHDH